MKKVLSLIIVPVMLILLVLPGTTAFAADRLCISQISVEAGANAAEKLEKNGYTVIYQNLNPSGGERIYMGYKLGEAPITDLIVSSAPVGSIEVNSVTYTSVSSVNLNQGTGGTPVYLFCTRDTKAGSGILSLFFVKNSEDGAADILDTFGDGSVPVRTADGKAADFDEGINERDLFCFAVHENSCLPFVSEVKIVNIGAVESAFEKIAASGCDYFNAAPLSQMNGTSTYLCFNRTADASSAVRAAVFSDSGEIDGIEYISAGSCSLNGEALNLYYTKDASAGNPVAEIIKGSLTDSGFTRGDWAKAYFSRASSSAMSSIYDEDLYSTLVESDEEYLQLKVKNIKSGSDTDLFMILSANGANADGSEARTVTLPEEDFEETSEMQRDTEITGISKEEQTEDSPAEGDALNAYGSAIGGGSLIAIAAMAVIMTIAAAILVFVKGRKNGKND